MHLGGIWPEKSGQVCVCVRVRVGGYTDGSGLPLPVEDRLA